FVEHISGSRYPSGLESPTAPLRRARMCYRVTSDMKSELTMFSESTAQVFSKQQEEIYFERLTKRTEALLQSGLLRSGWRRFSLRPLLKRISEELGNFLS